MSLDVPPYILAPLLPAVDAGEISCAQALGSEVYVGCTNGTLLRYTLRIGPDQQESYSLSSHQSLSNGKPVDELVLVPYMSRVLVRCDRQIHFYTIPSLNPMQNVQPIRNVEALAVDHQHLLRPPPSHHDLPVKLQPVNFCVIKRNAIVEFSLQEERLAHIKEIPFQSGVRLARRTGHHLCVADTQNYNIIDLLSAQMYPLLPVNQFMDDKTPVQPFIMVVGSDFLMLSWTGAGSLGVFINGEGDPVRGTLQFSSHPVSVCLDYPTLTAILPGGTIEIHDAENQAILQVIPPPAENEEQITMRNKVIAAIGGYRVPSQAQSAKLQKTKVKLCWGPEQVEDSA